ncbi:1-acyl-sn-glycerol-3-phosphate acyltransferase [Galactobacter sp.]|uniref:lysophospholipid acyltransferase family protein n=1 Tax=Galactobacter sp. TaxID=2676125 RepID=UPI0025C188D6|nr:lysophospholipid acyltransferase family protein [Galactobacter sp.]
MRRRPRLLGQTKEPLAARIGFATLANAARPVANLLLGHTWRGFDRIPPGSILVANHVTELDPVTVGLALYDNGINPRFLAKESLFKLPVVGKLLTQSGQIPVDRGGAGAGASLRTARQVLDRGGCIVVYPDGTLTRDPDLWPQKARTGAARLALKTGAPVIPVAHWGDQELLPPYAKRIHPFPRKHVTVRAGDPVDLDDLRGGKTTRTVLNEATDRIVAALTAEVARLRPRDTPPETPWDPEEHGQSLTGHPTAPAAQAGGRTKN